MFLFVTGEASSDLNTERKRDQLQYSGSYVALYVNICSFYICVLNYRITKYFRIIVLSPSGPSSPVMEPVCRMSDQYTSKEVSGG